MPTRLEDAALALKNGMAGEALRLVTQQISENPNDGYAWVLLAAIQNSQGRLHEAEQSYDRATVLLSRDYRVWHGRARILHKAGRPEDALVSIDTALKLNSRSVSALERRGKILASLNRHDDAIASFERCLNLDGSRVEVRYALALALSSQSRYADALVHFDRAILLAPGQPDIHNARGIALQAIKRHDDALAAFDEAIAKKPGSAHFHYNRGIALHDLRRYSEALMAFDSAIGILDGVPEFYIGRANTCRQVHQYQKAKEDYTRSIELAPGRAEYYSYRGSVFLDLDDLFAALDDFNRAATLAPANANFAHLAGTALEGMKRFRQALLCHERALQLDPSHPLAFNGLAGAALSSCDWPRVSEIEAELPRRIRDGNTIFAPFVLLGYGVSPDLQLEATERYLHEILPQAVCSPLPGHRGTRKLRLGYLSADFGEHATTYLAIELFERHDRDRFEVIGLSFGSMNESRKRHQVITAFDSFHELGHLSDEAAADLIRNCGVDICIDLKGHTKGARPGILAYRPAPIQVSYLGYPATVGSCGVDYVVADEVVLPSSVQPYYPETIVHLPGAYQVNSARDTQSGAVSRAEVGLPEDGFVFCCFNNNWKITAPVFGTWMNLLLSVPNSVLWLIKDNDDAEYNLRQAARQRGVNDGRLIFAERVSQERHLARHKLADLLLDTLPYNAHTTASDALLSGLPMVTCMGETFAGRVASSLLYALGLPDLVAKDLAEYESIARGLALDPKLLESFVRRLLYNRETTPALNAEIFCRKLENAYLAMWERGCPAAG